MGRAVVEEEEYEDGKQEEEEEEEEEEEGTDVGRAGAKKGWTLGRGGGGEVGGRKPATAPKGGATCGTHTHTQGDARRSAMETQGRGGET